MTQIPIPPVPLPAEVASLALEYDEGARAAVEPRNAATVILLRDGAVGIEVYLMRRTRSMAFAGGMCVFPGGGVDPVDHAAGVDGTSWAARLGVDAELAGALVAAAVRETEEECDVRLGADDLGVWTGWLTPRFEPRRYRTWFFVAALPDDQATSDISTESVEALWLPVGSAVERVEAGQLAMLPPTYLTCLELAQFDSVAAAMASAADRTVEMFMPTVEPLGDGFTLSMPDPLRPLLAARSR